MKHTGSSHHSEFTRLLTTRIGSDFDGDLRWRRHKDCVAGKGTVQVLGGCRVVLALWQDGVMTGFVETVRGVPRAARPAVVAELDRCVADGDLAWDFGRRGRLIVRITGLRLRGSPAAQVKRVVNGVFMPLVVLDRAVGDHFSDNAAN